MTQEQSFQPFKDEILKRAKECKACESEYKKAYRSETFKELMQVIKDNFIYAAENNIIDAGLIETYKEQFNKNLIFCNEDAERGYLLACGSATVKAYNSATVYAKDNAYVKAYDSASVYAKDNAYVYAYNSATVTASDYATVIAYDSASVRAYNSATVIALDNASVYAHENAYVKAYNSATVTSYSIIECNLTYNAIHRIRENNTILYASDNIKFIKQ